MEKYPSKIEFYAPANPLGCDQIHASLVNLDPCGRSSAAPRSTASLIPNWVQDGLPVNHSRFGSGQSDTHEKMNLIDVHDVTR